jgi:hypothetical protein
MRLLPFRHGAYAAQHCGHAGDRAPESAGRAGNTAEAVRILEETGTRAPDEVDVQMGLARALMDAERCRRRSVYSRCSGSRRLVLVAVAIELLRDDYELP